MPGSTAATGRIAQLTRDSPGNAARIAAHRPIKRQPRLSDVHICQRSLALRRIENQRRGANQLSIFSERIVARSGTLSIAGRCLNGTGTALLGPGNKAKGAQSESFKSPAMWRMLAHWSGTIFRCSVSAPPRKPKSSALDPIDAGPFSRERTTCLTRRNS